MVCVLVVCACVHVYTHVHCVHVCALYVCSVWECIHVCAPVWMHVTCVRTLIAAAP